MKTCTKCEVTQPVSAFSKHKNMKDGLRSNCKACDKAYRAANKDYLEAYKAANKERTAANNAAWSAANKDRRAAMNAAWYLANKDRRAAMNAAWLKANPEKSAATGAAYAKAHPEKFAASAHRRRARLASNGVNLVTAAETAAIIAQPCMACDAPAPSEIEHLIPITRGGTHSVGNLASLCRSCNSSKNNMTWTEWKYSNRAGARKVFAA